MSRGSTLWYLAGTSPLESAICITTDHRHRGTLLPAAATVSHYFRRLAAGSLLVAACRGRSPDTGGDTSLARDLAEVQIAGSASLGGRVTTESDTVAQPTNSTAVTLSHPAVVSGGATSGVTDSAHTAASSSRPRPAAPSRTRVLDPCSAPDSYDQSKCLELGLHNSNTRLNAIYESIVRAVRSEQRVPRRPDPAYVTKLDQTERKWLSWRDSECERRAASDRVTLWAVPRTKCIAEVTDARAAELNRILAQLRRR